MRKIIYILTLVVFLSSCQKDEVILPQIKQPVIKVDSTKTNR